MRNRFLLYAKAEVVGKRLYVFLLNFFIFFTIYFIYCAAPGEEKNLISKEYFNAREIAHVVVTANVLLILAMSFSKYHNSRTGASSVMLPVRQIDKFIHPFLVNGVILPIIITLLAYGNHLIWGQIIDIHEPFFTWKYHTIAGINNIIGLFIIGTVYFASGIFFKSLPYLWAFAILSAIYVIIKYVNPSFPDLVNTGLLLLICISIIYGSWIQFKKLQIR